MGKAKAKGGGGDAGGSGAAAGGGGGGGGGCSQVKVWHILCEKHSKVMEALSKIQAGEKFDQVASQYSEDAARKGGDLGWKRKKEVVAQFAEAAFKLQVGEMTQAPVKTQFGYHLILCEGRKAGVAQVTQMVWCLQEATPAGMLEPLGSELVARILQHLLPPDLRGGRPSAFAARSSPWGECAPALAALHAARQTCRLLDEAARTHLLHTVTLTPEAAIGAAAGAGRGAGGLCGPDWARLPGLRTLRLQDWRLASQEPRDAPAAAAFRSLFALGPGAAPLGPAALGCLAAVTALDLNDCELDAQSPAALTARLPGLKAVSGAAYSYGCNVIAAAAGAPGLERVYAPTLCLGAAGAAELARLPVLRALDVWMFEGADTCALLPCSRLTRLGCGRFGACGLTGLRTLTFLTRDWDIANVADWGAVARLSGLTRLACAIDPGDPAWPAHLARLTGLRELVLDVRPVLDEESEEWEEGAVQAPMHMLFEAAARLPRLHTLIATSTLTEYLSAEWSFGAVARFVRAPSALRRLELCGALCPPLAVVGALATHPRLRRLVVSCSADDFEAAEALAANVYAEGLDCAIRVLDVEEDLGEDAFCAWYWQ
ncbi:MAG: hypothetical protein J3K34DRAFT_527390 [Monoraphidium minutum]|nr:MAG: hypothetical protein J3K34DRAFT_527390 [Monoraphidium minutum]